LGEASLFMAMGAAGLVTTAFSPAGFVAATGPRRPVVMASLCLLLAVGVALIAAIYFRGNVKFAAVIPVIALSWLNRLLRRVVQRQYRVTEQTRGHA
jgi:phosphotransferase system  glucose/maltose/N-acetylglucosamine-specific IIC component